MKPLRISSSRARAWLTAGGPILALVLVCVGSATALLSSFAREQDEAFARHTAQLVRSASRAQVLAIENAALDYAVWDEAYQHTTLRWDAPWIDDNLYSNIVDGVLIVRSDGAVRHAWFAENSQSRAAGLTRAVAHAIQTDLNLGPLLVAPEKRQMTATTMAALDGELTLISAAPISPDTHGRNPARPVDYLVMVQSLSPQDLATMGVNLALPQLHFAAAARNGEQALPMRGAAGNVVGVLAWPRETPGQRAFAAKAGAIIVGLLMLGAAALALALWLVSRHMDADARLRVASEASRVKSEFIGAMSHELRTPLNAIIGYAGLIQEEASDLGVSGGAIHDDAERLMNSAQHLARLVNDVLDQSRIEAGKLKVVCESVSATAALIDLEEAVRPLADASGNQFTVEIADSVGEVHADPLRLSQCLLNLTSNALKFTRNGQVTVRVSRVLDHAQARIQFEVADTGIGMTRDEMKRLFQPFSQANSTVAVKFGGTGLGLSISRSLARAMGGDILVQSQPDVGSVFTLLLPAAPAPPVRLVASAA